MFNIPQKGIYQGDPATLWTVRPHLDQNISNPPYPFHVRTDEHGLRGTAHRGDWLALGCSTTFGWGVKEDEAWPAQLSKTIGIPIINGGVPGWSTHQAKQKVGDWNVFEPPVVLVSYIVRDAQPAQQPDWTAKPSPLWTRLQLFRWMTQALTPKQEKMNMGETNRVPVDEYQKNLRLIQAAFPNAEVLFFAFPQQKPAQLWVDTLKLFPILSLPKAPEDWFFEEDAIHLNPKGHRQLAQALRASLVDASILPPVH